MQLTRPEGRELGPYRLLRELGRGGMGLLYEAEHTHLGRTVALKLLAPQLAADESFRERFIRESQLLAAMEHPNIIPIYDAGEADGLLYISMRYVEGADLAALISRVGALEPEASLSIVEQVGSALDAAHARDLVHRDVKPANILLDEPADRVFLSDFGVARRGRAAGSTTVGAIVGTVDYAAPEQLQGERVGPAVDVYALGCVFYESLTGRRAFPKETDVAVMFAHALEPPPAVSAVRPELPAALDAVIARAMAKDPAARYDSCQALVADARAALGLAAAAPAGPAMPSRAAPIPSSLPVRRTELVGRGRELRALEDLLLESTRLLTVTGPGGTGKTSLAIELARTVAREFPGGVAFVDLTSVSDPGLVVSALAGALGVEELGSGAALQDAVSRRLQGPPVLVVMDNFEHLLAAAPLVGQLLAVVPSLKVLVTSHARLHLSEEHEYPLRPLELPAAGDTSDVAAALRSPAVALFSERARTAAPAFTLDERNVATVCAICARLDGLPLAIELAVARLRLFSPEAMLARLGSALDLLTGGAGDLPARHRTLRAAIEWSYELLEPPDQLALERLAVFSGGFTLEAAEAVSQQADATVERVESLLGQSLLRREDEEGDEPRFGMLHSIQEYALFRLLERGEVDDARHRHARYYAELAARAEPELVGPSQAAWIRRLETESGNLRATLAWALESGELELGIRAASALTRFWSVRGHMAEGRRWLNLALARGGEVSAPVLEKGLYAAGYAALGQGDFREARTRFEESLALARELGDGHAIAMATAQLGWLAAGRGDTAEAVTISEESLVLSRRLGDARTASVALANLAEAAATEGQYDRAAELLEESLALRRGAGDRRNIANAILNLGRVELARRRDAAAVSLLHEGLELARELEDTWGISVGLTSLAVAALGRGDHARAETLLAESLALSSERHDARAAAECLAALATVAQARGEVVRAARLGGAAEGLRQGIGAASSPLERRLEHPDGGDEASRAERARGRRLSFEEAVAYALELPARSLGPPDGSRIHPPRKSDA